MTLCAAGVDGKAVVWKGAAVGAADGKGVIGWWDDGRGVLTVCVGTVEVCVSTVMVGVFTARLSVCWYCGSVCVYRVMVSGRGVYSSCEYVLVLWKCVCVRSWCGVR